MVYPPLISCLPESPDLRRSSVSIRVRPSQDSLSSHHSRLTGPPAPSPSPVSPTLPILRQALPSRTDRWWCGVEALDPAGRGQSEEVKSRTILRNMGLFRVHAFILPVFRWSTLLLTIGDGMIHGTEVSKVEDIQIRPMHHFCISSGSLLF